MATPAVIFVKTCTECGLVGGTESFYRRSASNDGFQPRCKSCDHRRSGDRKRKYPEQHAVYQRRSVLRSQYCMEEWQYAEMLASQSGVCAACGTSDPGTNRNNFSIHHNHRCCPTPKTCGKCVIALLCDPCNLLLGKFGDDAERIARLSAFATRQAATLEG